MWCRIRIDAFYILKTLQADLHVFKLLDRRPEYVNPIAWVLPLWCVLEALEIKKRANHAWPKKTQEPETGSQHFGSAGRRFFILLTHTQPWSTQQIGSCCLIIAKGEGSGDGSENYRQIIHGWYVCDVICNIHKSYPENQVKTGQSALDKAYSDRASF